MTVFVFILSDIIIENARFRRFREVEEGKIVLRFEVVGESNRFFDAVSFVCENHFVKFAVFEFYSEIGGVGILSFFVAFGEVRRDYGRDCAVMRYVNVFFEFGKEFHLKTVENRLIGGHIMTYGVG